MGDKIGFTLRLTPADWDDGLNAWRCPAVDIPGASIEQARDAKGKLIELELLKIEKGPARSRGSAVVNPRKYRWQLG